SSTGLSVPGEPGPDSSRHIASRIGWRNRWPSWRIITSITWVDSARFTDAWPVRGSSLTALTGHDSQTLSAPSRRCPYAPRRPGPRPGRPRREDLPHRTAAARDLHPAAQPVVTVGTCRIVTR